MPAQADRTSCRVLTTRCQTVVHRRTAKPIVNPPDPTCLISNELEGTPLKTLYALVFVLVSFAAPAQTLETWIAAYHLDELDCFGETTQQSTMPPQIIGIELLCAAILNDADGIASTGSNGAEDVPVGAIQPSNENNNQLKADNTSAFIEDQSAVHNE